MHLNHQEVIEIVKLIKAGSKRAVEAGIHFLSEDSYSHRTGYSKELL